MDPKSAESEGDSTDDNLIPDANVEDPAMYGEHTQASIVQQLVWAKGKYKRAKKASFVLLSFSALLLVMILFFAYAAYTGSGFLNSAEDNPYLEDGNQTLSWMKPTIDPCTDFAGYAVGAWTDSITLAKGVNQVSLTFGTARDTMRKKLQAIVEADWPYLRPFYDSCLGTPVSLALKTARMAPISHWVLKLSAANELPQLFITMARMRFDSGIDLGFPFSVGPTISPKNASRYLVGLEQSGFLLPAKAYYTEASTIDFYRGWIQQMFSQVGLSLDTPQVNDIIALETTLAMNSLDMDQQYDPYVTYNPINRTDLNLMLGSSLYAYFTALNLTNLPSTLDDVNYFTQLRLIIEGTNMETTRNILLLRLFYKTFPFIDDQTRLVTTGLAAQIQGVESKSKQEYCVDLTVANLGMLVSHYYVVESFDDNDRNSTAQMMTGLVERYKTLVSSWSWLDSVTKAKALEKYEKLSILLAYPKDWPDYDQFLVSLQLNPLTSTSLLNNVLKLSLVSERQALASLKRPVPQLQWLMDPIEINAYYDPPRNQIVIPAGIQETPFFSAQKLPYAARLAKLGAVLAHELAHVIAQSGAEYDSTGVLRDWQSPSARAGFAERVACIAAQYSGMTVDQSHWINGQLVAGEAMADWYGLTQAYEELLHFLELTDSSTDLEEKLVTDAYNNLTPQQVFFIKFAQLWSSVTSPAYELALSRSDPHPPARDRLLGTLRNMPSFSEAFSCPVGSVYNPETKCSIH